MRTIEEIKQYYEELRESFKSTNSSDEWVGEPIKEKWLMLDHIASLEAQNAALQARAEAVGELRPPDESPPLNYTNDEAKYFRFEAYKKVEALVRMPLVKQMHFGKDEKEGLIETEWQGGNSPFFGFRIPHEQVIGWRPLPESPTAEE